MTDPNAPQQPAYQQPPAGYQQPAYSPGPSKALSLTSMILGIAGLVVGWFTFGIGGLASIAAVITGHIAVKREPHAKGFWLTGLITGYVGIASAVVVFIIVVVVFGIIAATASTLGTIPFPTTY